MKETIAKIIRPMDDTRLQRYPLPTSKKLILACMRVNHIQGACNAMAVSHILPETFKTVKDSVEDQASFSTSWLNEHPLITALLDKLVSLNGGTNIDEKTRFGHQWTQSAVAYTRKSHFCFVHMEHIDALWGEPLTEQQQNNLLTRIMWRGYTPVLLSRPDYGSELIRMIPYLHNLEDPKACELTLPSEGIDLSYRNKLKQVLDHEVRGLNGEWKKLEIVNEVVNTRGTKEGTNLRRLLSHVNETRGDTEKIELKTISYD